MRFEQVWVNFASYSAELHLSPTGLFNLQPTGKIKISAKWTAPHMHLMLKIFLTLLAAHFCVDWLGYSRGAAGGKRDANLWLSLVALGRHCLKHAALSGLFLGWLSDWRLVVYGGLYVLIAHFWIDFIRIKIENLLFDPADFQLLKRREVFDYLRGHRGRAIDRFMGKYFHRWILLNLADQSAHLLTLGTFAATYALRHAS
jgi:hypothetical protein